MGDYDAGALDRELKAAAVAVDFPAGSRTLTVSDAIIGRLASQFGLSKRAAELAALGAGLCPRRYLKSSGTFGLDGQARLLGARVGVAGLGGLGGFIVEILCRAGVGELVLADPDTFSEDNLNRQLLSTEGTVGQAKAHAAVERLAKVNSATAVEAHQCRGDRRSFARLFAGAAVVVDALDSLGARFDLQDAATELGVPMVHGAIAGLSGQVTTVFPGDPGLECLYGSRDSAARTGVEMLVGNPSATPPMVAAFEAQEVLKILTGVGQPLRRKLLILDALSPYAAVVEL